MVAGQNHDGGELLRHALRNRNDISSSFSHLRHLGRELRAGRSRLDYLKQLDWYKEIPQEDKAEWKRLIVKCRNAAMFRDRFALPAVQEKYAALIKMDQGVERQRRNANLAAAAAAAVSSAANPETRFSITSDLDTTWLFSPRLGEVEFQESRHTVSLPNLGLDEHTEGGDTWSRNPEHHERMSMNRQVSQKFSPSSSTAVRAGIALGGAQNSRRRQEQRMQPIRDRGRRNFVESAPKSAVAGLPPVADIRDSQRRRAIENLVILHNPPLGPACNYLYKARPVAPSESKVLQT